MKIAAGPSPAGKKRKLVNKGFPLEVNKRKKEATYGLHQTPLIVSSCLIIGDSHCKSRFETNLSRTSSNSTRLPSLSLVDQSIPPYCPSSWEEFISIRINVTSISVCVVRGNHPSLLLKNVSGLLAGKEIKLNGRIKRIIQKERRALLYGKYV